MPRLSMNVSVDRSVPSRSQTLARMGARPTAWVVTSGWSQFRKSVVFMAKRLPVKDQGIGLGLRNSRVFGLKVTYAHHEFLDDLGESINLGLEFGSRGTATTNWLGTR